MGKRRGKRKDDDTTTRARSKRANNDREQGRRQGEAAALEQGENLPQQVFRVFVFSLSKRVKISLKLKPLDSIVGISAEADLGGTRLLAPLLYHCSTSLTNPA